MVESIKTPVQACSKLLYINITAEHMNLALPILETVSDIKSLERVKLILGCRKSKSEVDKAIQNGSLRQILSWSNFGKLRIFFVDIVIKDGEHEWQQNAQAWIRTNMSVARVNPRPVFPPDASWEEKLEIHNNFGERRMIPTGVLIRLYGYANPLDDA